MNMYDKSKGFPLNIASLFSVGNIMTPEFIAESCHLIKKETMVQPEFLFILYRRIHVWYFLPTFSMNINFNVKNIPQIYPMGPKGHLFWMKNSQMCRIFCQLGTWIHT